MAKQSNFTSLYPPKKKHLAADLYIIYTNRIKKRADESHQLFFLTCFSQDFNP